MVNQGLLNVLGLPFQTKDLGIKSLLQKSQDNNIGLSVVLRYVPYLSTLHFINIIWWRERRHLWKVILMRVRWRQDSRFFSSIRRHQQLNPKTHLNVTLQNAATLQAATTTTLNHNLWPPLLLASITNPQTRGTGETEPLFISRTDDDQNFEPWSSSILLSSPLGRRPATLTMHECACVSQRKRPMANCPADFCCLVRLQANPTDRSTFLVSSDDKQQRRDGECRGWDTEKQIAMVS
ncbi:hypothetical protein LXL04_003910 [Taraxacum kok-saghyz]